MTEWILYGVKPYTSFRDFALNRTVLLNAGFISKEDAMVYWHRREREGCFRLLLKEKADDLGQIKEGI